MFSGMFVRIQSFEPKGQESSSLISYSLAFSKLRSVVVLNSSKSVYALSSHNFSISSGNSLFILILPLCIMGAGGCKTGMRLGLFEL